MNFCDQLILTLNKNLHFWKPLRRHLSVARFVSFFKIKKHFHCVLHIFPMLNYPKGKHLIVELFALAVNSDLSFRFGWKN